MRAAYLDVSAHLLAQELHFPEGHEVVGAEWDFSRSCVRLYLRGPTLPIAVEGCTLQRVVLEVTTIGLTPVVVSQFCPSQYATPSQT